MPGLFDAMLHTLLSRAKAPVLNGSEAKESRAMMMMYTSMTETYLSPRLKPVWSKMR